MQIQEISTESILSNLNLEKLNDLQHAAIEASASYDNLVILAPTGSGKTLAFLIPLLKRLDPSSKLTGAMIIVPSRELALQIETVFKTMGTGLKISCCYGGHKREIEENNLIQAPALIVGTPGRIADHLRRGNIKPAAIESLVLDEYDKSLEMGFQEEISAILSALPSIKKRTLTSATEAIDIPEFIGMKDAHTLNFLPEGGTEKEALTIQTVISPDKDKIDTLFRLICFHGNRSSIIFCNHREAVERTSGLLTGMGITNTYYHGAMEQRDREIALAKFRNGSVNFLVTTDLAARGLDIPNIRYIIHYHLPTTPEIFIHRNGRTARMDASGTAILILNDEETLPSYITTKPEEINLPEDLSIPDKPKWATLYISAGKKDKVNKVDIVGFLSNRANLKKEDIGLIEVKDFFSFAAVRRTSASAILQDIKDHKLKNKKVKIEIAKIG
ncbi:MAG: DEAD/DEAH box helicase [Chitinophagaceae bacterium]